MSLDEKPSSALGQDLAVLEQVEHNSDQNTNGEHEKYTVKLTLMDKVFRRQKEIKNQE